MIANLTHSLSAVSLYSADDGSRVAFTLIEDTHSTAKDIPRRPETWLWCNLSVIYIEGVCLIQLFHKNIADQLACSLSY